MLIPCFVPVFFSTSFPWTQEFFSLPLSLALTIRVPKEYLGNRKRFLSDVRPTLLAVPLHAMKSLWGRGIAPTHSRTRQCMAWMVSVTPWPRFSPGERTPGTHCTGGWVGPRAGLDAEARGKTLSPLPGIEPRLPGRTDRSETLYWLSYPAHASHLTLIIYIYPHYLFSWLGRNMPLETHYRILTRCYEVST
jgi:hypothetical protein